MKETERIETLEFHIKLLSSIIDKNDFPFTGLLIKNNVTKGECEKLLKLLEELNYKYILQKEAGFLDFTSLLVQFAGMLDEKLNPDETIKALKKEGYYPSLMEALTKVVEQK